MSDQYEREASKAAIKVLQRELAEARKEISDLQGDVEAWKRETMIANARLRGEKHPDDNGAISTKEIIPKLQRELAEAREQRDMLAKALDLSLEILIALIDDNEGVYDLVVTTTNKNTGEENEMSVRKALEESIAALAAAKGGSDD